MRQLEPYEAEFVAMADRLFEPLQHEGCLKELDADVEAVQIRFLCEAVAIELRFESERALFAYVVPLEAGRPPRRFDERGRERLTRFPLADLLEGAAPGWRPHTDLDQLSDRDDLLEVLTALAHGLRDHGKAILHPDRPTLERFAAAARRDLSLAMLDNWAGFVDRVRRGYSGTIADYTTAISERAQLQGVLEAWPGNGHQDPRAQLAHLDRTFDEATDPIDPTSAANVFSLLPAPEASRWWRRPKKLVGALRDYFATRT